MTHTALPTLKEVEKEYILYVVGEYRNYEKAAHILNVSKSTLWRRLKEYGVDLSGTWSLRNKL